MLQTAKTKLSELGKNITAAQRDFAEAKRNLKEWQDNIEGRQQSTASDYSNKFDELLKIDKVLAVEVADNSLNVYTDTIYIDFNSARYEIGMFKIVVPIFTCTVYVYNLCSTHPSKWDHPYGTGGGFCFGNLGNFISNALNKKEYASAVVAILQALQSAQGDNQSAVQQWRKVS